MLRPPTSPPPPTAMEPLRVQFPTHYKLLPFLMCVGCALLAFLAFTLKWGFFQTAFWSLGALASPFLYLTTGPLEMTDEFVRMTIPLGCHQMNWDEVEELETSPQKAGEMVLHGHGKKFPIPATSLWTGADKEAMMQLFAAQIESRGIPTRRSRRAAHQWFKNTKVKRET